MSTSDREPHTPREPAPSETARPLAELVEQRARELADHPDPEKMRAYARGELASAEAETFREHLVVCGDCLDLLLLHPDLRVDDERAVDFETFKAWREMRARIREHEVRKKLARRTRHLHGLQAVAALLVLAIGLVWTVGRQDGSNGATPVPNSAIFDVKRSQVRGFGHEPLTERTAPVPPAPYVGPTSITVPEGIDSFTLVFWLDAPDFDAYEILLRDRDDQEIWRSRELKVELGTATLGLSRQYMKAGRYRVEIYGIENDGRTRIGDYSIDLHYS